MLYCKKYIHVQSTSHITNKLFFYLNRITSKLKGHDNKSPIKKKSRLCCYFIRIGIVSVSNQATVA